MRPLVAVVMLGVGVSAGAAQEPPTDYRSHPACRLLNNSFRCARAVEAVQLQAAAAGITRAGDTLELELTGGGSILLLDGRHPSGADIPPSREAGSYSYFGVVPGTRFAVIHSQFGEGNAYGLLHLGTGRYSEVEGFPVVSPDRRWVLISENGYFNRVGVFIHRVEDDSVRPDWSLENAWETWAPGTARWQATTAIVDRLALTLPGDPDVVVGRLVIRRVDGQWMSAVE